MKDNIFIKIFNHIEETLLSAAFIAMTLICFIQVITRYILHFSLPWSEEVLRALFVWSSCLGISIAFRTKSHMGVDAVVNLFPRKAKFALSIISYLIVIAFCVIMIYFSAGVTWKQIATQQTTIALDADCLRFHIPCSRFLPYNHQDYTGAYRRYKKQERQ